MSNASYARQPVRVALQRWGIAKSVLRAMVDTLTALDGRIEWTDGEEDVRADLVLHVVDMAGLAGPSYRAPWNLMGPVDALRHAREQGIAAIALASGEPQRLSCMRTGCWIAAGALNLVTAARTLVGETVLSDIDEDATTRQQRLCALAARDSLTALHAKLRLAYPGPSA